MSKLRTFRIDGHRLERRETEFLAKIEDDQTALIGTFDMTGEGVFYYKPGSHIMTDKENDSTRESYDGFLSFENLRDIFKFMSSAGWNRDKHTVEVTESDNFVILKPVADE